MYCFSGLQLTGVAPSSRLRLDPWIIPSIVLPLRDTAWTIIHNRQNTAFVQCDNWIYKGCR